MVNKEQLAAQNILIDELRQLIVELQEKVKSLEKKQESYEQKAIFQKQQHGPKFYQVRQRKMNTTQTS